ncbi:MAG TPA: YfhO family protein [Acidobacteriota bacterium]|nr:YfhO family protein [Acidobacteriota bacterium]
MNSRLTTLDLPTKTGLILLYAPILLVLFFPVLFLDRTLDPSRFVQGMYMDGPQPETERTTPTFVNDAGAVVWALQPWNHFISERLKTGELPLWNPYQGAGVPLAANFQSGVFSPLQWPFFLFSNTGYWDWLYVMRLLLAGGFTFLFLSTFQLSAPAAWLGGLCFMLCGYLIDYINMNHLNVELLLPALFYFGEKWVLKPGKNFAFLVICLSLSVLGGMPEATLIAWIFLFSYLVFRLASTRSGWHSYRLIGLAGCLGVLCSGILLLPGFEYIVHGGGKHHDFAWGETSLSPAGVVSILVPFFFGHPGSGWNPHIDKAFGAASGIGLIPLGLAIYGGWRRGPRWRLFFGFAALVVLFKIYGVPGINAIGRLPILDLIIFSKYLQIVLAFSIAALAALGFQALLLGHHSTSRIRFVFHLLSGTVLAFYLFHLESIWNSTRHLVMVVSAYSLFAVLMGAAAGFLLGPWGQKSLYRLLSRRSDNRLDRIGQRAKYCTCGVIMLMTFSEVFFLSIRLHPAAIPERETPAFVHALDALTGDQYRMSGSYVLFPNLATTYRLSDLRVLDPILPRRFVDFSERVLSRPFTSRFTGLDLWDYSHPFLDLASVRYIATERDLRNYLFRLAPSATPVQVPLGRGRVIDLLEFVSPVEFGLSFRDEAEVSFHLVARAATDVRLVIGRSGEDQLILQLPAGELLQERIDLQTFEGGGPLEFAFQGAGKVQAALFLEEQQDHSLVPVFNDPDSSVVIFERPSALPIYRLVSRARCVEPERVLDELVSPNSNLQDSVLLEDCSQVPEFILGSMTKVNGRVQVLNRTGNRVELETQADRPAVLVIGQTYFPGWHLLVDDEPVPLMSANYLFSAAVVPEGKHRVELEFRPASVRFGLLLSLLGLLLTAIAAFWLRAQADATPPRAGKAASSD